MEKKLFELIISIRKKCLHTEEKIRSDLGLTPGEFNGFLSMEPGERVPGAAFSERMGLSPSRGSRVFSRMFKNGYIHLETLPGDRRIVEASFTQKGEKMRERVLARLDECEKRILSSLSDQQVHALQEALQFLVKEM